MGRKYFGGPTEDFATVVLDRAVATSHSNTVTVADSEIYSDNKPQTATNHQYSIDAHRTLFCICQSDDTP